MRRAWNSSRDSVGRTTEADGRAWVFSPWRRAFWDERARPAGIAGPWDLVPLARAVADFLLDVGLGLVGILVPG